MRQRGGREKKLLYFTEFVNFVRKNYLKKVPYYFT